MAWRGIGAVFVVAMSIWRRRIEVMAASGGGVNEGEAPKCVMRYRDNQCNNGISVIVTMAASGTKKKA